MTAPIDRAYVEIIPDMRRFNSNLKSGVSNSIKGTTEQLNGMTTSVNRHVSQATSRTQRGVHSLGVSVKQMVGTAIGASAGLAAVQFFKSAITEARTAQRNMAATAAVIRSQGNAAKVTAKEVEALGVAIMKKTGIDHDQIQSGENLLLTFANIKNQVGAGNDIFTQATKVIVDTSVALKQDLKSSAIQVGKALQDPIKGVTALRRVGVMLTDQQTSMIKAMVEGGRINALNALGYNITKSEMDKLEKKMGSAAKALKVFTDQMTPAQKKQFEYYQQGNHMADAQKVILKELRREFGGQAEAQSTAGSKMAVAWTDFKELVGQSLLPVLDKLETWITNRVLPAMTSMFEGLKKGKGPIHDLVEFFKSLGEALAPIVKAVFDLGREAWPAVVGVMRTVNDMMKDATSWMRDHKDLTQAMAASIVAYFAAWKAFTIFVAVKKAMDALTKSIIMGNMAMKGNIILVLVAALAGLIYWFVHTYKTSETFRDKVNGVLKNLKHAFDNFWHAVQNVMHALRTAWDAVWKAVSTAWEAVGKPIFNVMKIVFRVWWAIVKGIFTAYINIFKFVWNTVSFIWNTIGKPIFQVMWWIARVWWGIVQVIFKAYIWWFRQIWHLAQAAWRNVGAPVFNAITTAARWMWNHVLSPIFSAISTVWDSTWGFVSKAWHRTGSPIIRAVVNAVQWMSDHLGKIFGAIGRAWNRTWGAISNGFSSIWEGIKNGMIKGVNAVIGFFNWFIDKINWVLDKLPNHPTIPRIPTLGGGGEKAKGGGTTLTHVAGGGSYAMGGVLPGRSKTDNISIPVYKFRGGESILVPEATDAFGGKPGIDKINKMFSGGGGKNPPGHFLFGGLTDFVGKIGHAVGTGLGAVAGLVRKGVAKVLSAALTAAEFPIKTALKLLPKGLIKDTATGGFGLIDKTIRALIAKIGGEARKKAASMYDVFNVGPIPVGAHLALIKQALQLAGVAVTDSNIASVNTIVSYESGWNPNAINLSDSNAAAGHPSQGLMQTIPSTFNAYRLLSLSANIRDPLANLVAGIRYAISRYGSLFNVPGLASLRAGGGYVGYEFGTMNVPKDQVARLHKGEMVVPATVAGQLRAAFGGLTWQKLWDAHLLPKVTKSLTDALRAIGHAPAAAKAPPPPKAINLNLIGYDKVEAQINRARRLLERAIHLGLDKKTIAKDRAYLREMIKEANQGLSNLKVKINTQDISAIRKLLVTGTAPQIGNAFWKLILDASRAGLAHPYRIIREQEKHLLDLVAQRVKATKNLATETAKLKTLTAQWFEERKTVREAVQGTFDITTAGAGGTDKYGNPVALSINSIINQVKSMAANARRFAALLRKLGAEGLNAVLLGQLAAAGPAAMATAEALAAATPKKIKELNLAYKDFGVAADIVGISAAEGMYKVGMDASKALIKGLQSQQSALNKAIRKLAERMIAELKRALKIHSDSAVMIEMGSRVTSGFVSGIDNGLPGVARSSRTMARKAAGSAIANPSANAKFDEDKLAQAFARALSGMAIEFDGDGLARLVTKRQSVMATRGIRR